MPLHLSPRSVIRVSLANFDPSRTQDVERMTQDTGRYLIPKISELPGLTAYFAAVSPTGSTVHISLWEDNVRADQMSRLKEMIVDARRDAEAVGAHFTPIVNYPIAWHI